MIDEERLRHALAADLHAGLGQEIALVKLLVSSLRATANAEHHEPLTGILQVVDLADRSLRSVSYQISPASLYDLGLLAALQSLGEKVYRRFGMSVQIVNNNIPAVADHWNRVILFRAVRELLANAATHAHVPEVEVQLASQGNAIRITVEDLGSGFEIGDHDQQPRPARSPFQQAR